MSLIEIKNNNKEIQRLSNRNVELMDKLLGHSEPRPVQTDKPARSKSRVVFKGPIVTPESAERARQVIKSLLKSTNLNRICSDTGLSYGSLDRVVNKGGGMRLSTFRRIMELSAPSSSATRIG